MKGKPSSAPEIVSLPGALELIPFFPANEAILVGSLPAERETEARHRRIRGPIPSGTVFVAWLMVVVLNEVFILSQSPSLVVAFELDSLVDGKGGYTNARQAEVIGAVIVSGLGMRIRANLEAEILR